MAQTYPFKRKERRHELKRKKEQPSNATPFPHPKNKHYGLTDNPQPQQPLVSLAAETMYRYNGKQKESEKEIDTSPMC